MRSARALRVVNWIKSVATRVVLCLATSGLLEIIPENRNHAQRFDGLEIGDDLACSFERIFCFELIGDGSPVDEGIVENLLSGMSGLEGADVIGSREAETLIRLCHQITDINLDRR